MDWAEQLHCAITVCDNEGTIIYMNERSRLTFSKDGASMVGQNLFPCHQERSRQMIRHMMESDTTNCYTISKNGVRKMIFQSPWKVDGQVKGMVEISIVLPDEMPHYDR
ncbi:MAG: PAS domain-containing protein [Muribaculaceae bacterium]|nr:PAS domain-containing protein [Muribaculaceae bacterium]